MLSYSLHFRWKRCCTLCCMFGGATIREATTHSAKKNVLLYSMFCQSFFKILILVLVSIEASSSVSPSAGPETGVLFIGCVAKQLQLGVTKILRKELAVSSRESCLVTKMKTSLNLAKLWRGSQLTPTLKSDMFLCSACKVLLMHVKRQGHVLQLKEAEKQQHKASSLFWKKGP